MSAEHTQFDYLLNALMRAAQADKPAEHDYSGRRAALLTYVRELEIKAAAGAAASALAIQEGGDHYKKLGQYQPWEVLARWLTPEELKGAMKKEVVTYLAREADKGGILDIKKAAHTLQIYLELAEQSHGINAGHPTKEQS